MNNTKKTAFELIAELRNEYQRKAIKLSAETYNTKNPVIAAYNTDKVSQLLEFAEQLEELRIEVLENEED